MKRRAKCNAHDYKLLPKSLIASVLIGAFVTGDLLILKSMTNLIFTESPLMVWFTAAIVAMILDIPMTVAGNVWQQYRSGLREKRSSLLIIAICAAAFLLAFALCLSMRWVMRDILYAGVGVVQGGLVDLSSSAGQNVQDNTAAICASTVFFGLLPLATSLASLGVGLCTSDPVKERLRLLRIQYIQLQEEIASVNAVLAECGDLDAEARQMREREETLYQEFLASIDAQTLELKQKARQLLMEKLATPEAITAMTEQAKNLNVPRAGQSAGCGKPPVELVWSGPSHQKKRSDAQ